ncbi:hypothetical protein GCM10011490_21160 [Pseudoclavibacter endophyticus]|uniref:Uncharacterized protein n=1 Tax=Pseudoclavibacter endophyticus TaxID=1778590 RepID=A0A6H9WI67_9MICO|nr:hypothetical protein [Pseudoclavibacter endophyticus]KAB1648167.1 hypothetical protein F8O04_10645 [Pseudoclavibacter endophyticus]GGA70294.1 hypothetical protein GCM10011490_21160 [Pseudoclavibacter endophyticus]
MPREAVLLTTDPIRLMELGEAVQRRPERLGVQGIDRGGSAAILHPDGRLVCSVQAPVRLETIDEVHRLRPDATSEVSFPCYWHDAWVAPDDEPLGVACLEALASMTRGVLVLSPAVSVPDRHRTEGVGGPP